MSESASIVYASGVHIEDEPYKSSSGEDPTGVEHRALSGSRWKASVAVARGAAPSAATMMVRAAWSRPVRPRLWLARVYPHRLRNGAFPHAR